MMLGWAILFAVLAFVAGAVGYFVLVGLAAATAKILFFFFLVLLFVSFIIGTARSDAGASNHRRRQP